MSKQILLPASVRREITTTFKVGSKALSRALEFKINSRRAVLLRAAALERGGLIYREGVAPKGFMPECETTFDHLRGEICQTIGADLMLIVNEQTGDASLHYRGEQIAEFRDVTVERWAQVVYGVQMIYNKLNFSDYANR